jgi:NCS1 family nucleobase:cation symporter-1
MAEVHHADGRVELDAASEAEVNGSPLYNHDLAPVKVAGRTWTTYNYAALWISMAHCVTTYYIASEMIRNGMSWGQALVTVALGNVIVLLPILANSHPGTKYGIPFPVYARASYGTAGANLPAIMRALVACGWFGVQCWIGGEALHTFFTALWPGWATSLGPKIGGHVPGEWISFALFWGINILIIFKGMDLLRKVENWAAPFVLVMTGVLLVWALKNANGLGAIISQPSKLDSWSKFFPVFVPALTAMIGYWSTLSLNMPDFTRYGRSQREQMIGQTIALPTTMTVFAGMGMLITSATTIIFHETIWDPIKLVARFESPWIVAIAMFTIAVAQLSLNIAANVVSPANDFANAFPKHINFARGGLITGIVGVLMCPWKLMGQIEGWLIGYSGGLGSIAGVLIVDYYFVRQKRLALADLYLPDGAYRYTSGWNIAAVVATLAGCAIAWAGLFLPALHVLYDYAWFVGLAVAGGLYWLLMRGTLTAQGASARYRPDAAA